MLVTFNYLSLILTYFYDFIDFHRGPGAELTCPVGGSSPGVSSKQYSCYKLQEFILQVYKIARLHGLHGCKTARLQDYMEYKATCCKDILLSLVAPRGRRIYLYIYSVAILAQAILAQAEPGQRKVIW